jgi:hypothetical protein
MHPRVCPTHRTYAVAAHLARAQVPTCCCLRTIYIEQLEQVEGGGEPAANPFGKVQQQCNFDTTCCLSTKCRAK